MIRHMVEVRIGVNKDKITWESLVGKVSVSEYGKTECFDYTEYPTESISIVEKYNGKSYTHKIPILDILSLCETLSRLGYSIVFDEVIKLSMTAVAKAQGLVQAGFSKLIKQEDNYTVDGIFPQTFLTKEELDYLLSEGIEEMLLSDIK